MKRKHKRYSRPKRPFDKARIEEEALIKKEYGLKNKQEIWKADAMVKSFREKAKKLISADEKEQTLLFSRLQKLGLKVKSIADVLSLDKKDYLERRLQTLVHRKRLCPTAKAARQAIVHKKVVVNGRAVDSPSYLVPVAYEQTIQLRKIKSIPKVVKEGPHA